MSSSSTNIYLKAKSKDNNINSNRYISKYSPREIFRKYLTIEDIKRHPEITPAIKGDKKVKLDILTNQKPKVINIKGVNNQKRIKFVSKLNSFHKLFFDNFKNNINSKEEIDSLNQENKNFSKNYKHSNNNYVKDKFKDIKSEYEKRNYYVSPIEGSKNIFNGNILLSNREELKNYILYDLGTSLGNCKSLSFLHKINKNLGDKTSERELKSINLKLDLLNLGKDKLDKDNKMTIQKTQDDINNVKETINCMDDINYFFDIDNKQYLDNLKNDSRGSSAKISTRVNSALNILENVKYPNNNNYPREINLSKLKSLIPNEINKNISNNNRKLIKKPNRMNYINRYRNSKLSNLLTENNNNSKKDLKHNKYYIKTSENQDLKKSNLEILYDRISKKDDLLNYQKEIKNYLSNKKYDVSIKMNPSSVCNNFENCREKIYQSECLKNDMQLRKQLGRIELNSQRINTDNKIKNKINNIEDKVIKLFCDINNPRKKEEN